MKVRILRNLGITFGVAALLLRWVFTLLPDFFEAVWFNGVFPTVRKIQYAVFSVVPLPGWYIAAFLLAAWLFWRLPFSYGLSLREKKRRGWGLFARRTANLLGGLAATFLLLWGFGYTDRGLASRIGIEKSTREEDFAAAYEEVMARALACRKEITALREGMTIEDLPPEAFNADVALLTAGILTDFGYHTETPVHLRALRPDGILKRLSISGIYNPWTGEANIDNALSSLPRIFTAAHEVAHAYGVTGEAEANFSAWLACRSATDPVVRYAGEYGLWRTIGSEINRSFPEEVREVLAARIPEELRADRQAIWEKAARHKAYFPEVSDRLNDAYLKSQGVTAGTDDYNDFAALYFSWQRRESHLKK